MQGVLAKLMSDYFYVSDVQDCAFTCSSVHVPYSLSFLTTRSTTGPPYQDLMCPLCCHNTIPGKVEMHHKLLLCITRHPFVHHPPPIFPFMTWILGNWMHKSRLCCGFVQNPETQDHHLTTSNQKVRLAYYHDVKCSLHKICSHVNL